MEIRGAYTKKGLELAAKLSAGTALAITRVEAGSGETAETDAALSHSCQTLAAGTPTHSGNTAIIPITLAAAQAAADYALTELGVYARDPEEGEILYKVYRLENPVEITAGGRLVLRFWLEETVSQNVDVTVVCSPAGLLLEADLDAAFARRMTSGGVNLHVAKTGSDETGDGSEANPYLTIMAAINSLPKILISDTTITVHAGVYDEYLWIAGFTGGGRMTVLGADGEEVQIHSVRLWGVQKDVTLRNLTLTGEQSDGTTLYIGNCGHVYLTGIVCETRSENPNMGAVFLQATTLVQMASSRVSNKRIALDVVASTLFLNNTVTGTGNTVAIRCGSGWGSAGGFAQKGGAAVEGAEQTAYGGQIF